MLYRSTEPPSSEIQVTRLFLLHFRKPFDKQFHKLKDFSSLYLEPCLSLHLLLPKKPRVGGGVGRRGTFVRLNHTNTW